ncbi:hypothetical protein J4E83_003570 [Alternaria metachromatica]|uniref:uncharacterized protein n=1 Tax=Alternaria metachromatica TaxID=283354 RepID=UPI0020C248CA|nr:uncharacterized protein J4E83_003570 [Alternaria metachromatica]KAI4629015.1 hypothetical protein J4E83_003570 [Alternaria metachromatica]
MEPPLKRPRADSADTVPSQPPTTTSNADPPSKAEPPVTYFEISKKTEALDLAPDNNKYTSPFSQRLLNKLAVEDPAVAARINEAYDAYLEKEKNTVVDFQYDIKQLDKTIPSKGDGPTTPAAIPFLSDKIQSTFFDNVTRICGRAHEFSSLGTKKNALDAVRKLLVLIVQIPDKKLRAAVAERINIEDAGTVAPSMADVVCSLTYAQREEVCKMPVDGATVTAAKGESGCPRGSFYDKFLELKKRDLLEAGFEISFAPFTRPLTIWPDDVSDGHEFDPEEEMEAMYEDAF